VKERGADRGLTTWNERARIAQSREPRAKSREKRVGGKEIKKGKETGD
jgi:hypothetical protein